MSKFDVLIVTSDLRWGRSASSFLKSFPDLGRVYLVASLMEAYNISETHAPAVAIVDSHFTLLEEYEMMLALFSALDIRWISVEAHPRVKVNNREVPQRNSSFGIFSLSKSSPPLALYQAIKGLLNSPRNKLIPVSKAERSSSLIKRIILIGSSTGGIDALRTVFAGFPTECPPAVIVQHTGQNFGDGLVRLLDGVCPARVVAATEGTKLQNGHVYVAAGQGRHLEFAQHPEARLRFGGSTPVSGHLPSIDVLFKSGAHLAKQVVAAILTGMGRDGTDGLQVLKRAGAVTLAQDQSSSIVYGMPRVAWETGAAQKQVPLSRMSSVLLNPESTKTEATRRQRQVL